MPGILHILLLLSYLRALQAKSDILYIMPEETEGKDFEWDSNDIRDKTEIWMICFQILALFNYNRHTKQTEAVPIPLFLKSIKSNLERKWEIWKEHNSKKMKIKILK